MKRKAVGFYWTLPVPWAGFTKLPADIEAAARGSRTIAYQRALIHAFAAAEGYALVEEAAFLEIEPDRGSRFIVPALEQAAARCRAHGAILLFVEFSGAQGWRSHAPMMEWLRRAEIEALPIAARPLVVAGELFDPHAHFARWRARQKEWSAGKPARRAQALARARALRAEGLSHAAIARQLESEGLPSLSGKPWTGESLRKLLKSC
ncbi:MAG: hypothetical protein KatS3mg120_1548 [Erythrobacter sp.]|nr:MAG: hypothetical protein KatS3mg120_1548 [Erythrobacter sp.]